MQNASCQHCFSASTLTSVISHGATTTSSQPLITTVQYVCMHLCRVQMKSLNKFLQVPLRNLDDTSIKHLMLSSDTTFLRCLLESETEFTIISQAVALLTSCERRQTLELQSLLRRGNSSSPR